MKKYNWNIQELCNSIKRSNLQIMCIEEEVQAKGIGKTLKKEVAENFPNLEKRCPGGL
jgi:sulfur transfer complex TusBCD TusB component (DsrH family)